MTATPQMWMRPGVRIPQPFDTIFFDVDGVLIKTVNSFYATDLAAAAYVVQTLHGLNWEERPLTLTDVYAFSQAGGFNSDHDRCYLLASLATARLREWRGTPLAARSTQEWADVARAAQLQGRGGRTWVEDTMPASARLDYGLLGEIYDELYWGAEGIRRWYGREPHHLPNAPGFVHTEEMLPAPDFPARLRSANVRYLGLITGRTGPQFPSALERLEAYSGERWWNVAVSADTYAKPDARALRLAIESVGAHGGLYIGDTADDYDLVRNYNATRHADEPPILIAMLVQPTEVELYQQRGADLIVSSVEDLLLLTPLL
jgi:HAD superfamily phosphatase